MRVFDHNLEFVRIDRPAGMWKCRWTSRGMPCLAPAWLWRPACFRGFHLRPSPAPSPNKSLFHCFCTPPVHHR